MNITIQSTIISDEACVSWHGRFEHWWMTSCDDIGQNNGWAWLEENVRCPYLGTTWRRGGSDRVLSSKLVALTSFSISITEGMEDLNKAILQLAKAPVRHGIVQNMQGVQRYILSSTKNFKTGKNNLSVDVRAVSKQVTRYLARQSKHRRQADEEAAKLRTEKRNLASNEKLYQRYKREERSARNEYYSARRKYNDALENYRRQQKQADDWEIGCAATAIFTFGLTCIGYAVNKADVAPARSTMNSRSSRLDSAVSSLNYYDRRQRQYLAKVRELETSLAISNKNLEFYRGNIAALKKKEKSLVGLEYKLKRSAIRLEAIVVSVSR